MHSGKVAHVWALLAIPVAMVLGLPTSEIDNNVGDCDSWESADEADSYPNTFSFSNTAFIASTAVNQLLPSTIPSLTTFATSVRTAQASSTSISSSTKAFIAPINTFIPVAPPSYAFYIQSGSRSGSSKTRFAVTSAGTGGSVTFTTNKELATKFTIDSSGDLVEQSPSQGYVATLDTDMDTQKEAVPTDGSIVAAKMVF
ncbi:hypothetical protein E4T39_03074 [Aureobasidium subglaciale]|nr:hypothetical protein E4T39_03074 [Aureobasidium subglaciale]